MAATGAIYGTKDAGRNWYFHLKGVLKKYGVVESSHEKGCYRLVRNGELHMLVHSHVDDLLVAIKNDSQLAKDTLEKIKAELHLNGGVKNSFEYLARSVQVSDKEVRITMPKSVNSIELIAIPADRKMTPTAECMRRSARKCAQC